MQIGGTQHHRGSADLRSTLIEQRRYEACAQAAAGLDAVPPRTAPDGAVTEMGAVPFWAANPDGTAAVRRSTTAAARQRREEGDTVDPFKMRTRSVSGIWKAAGSDT